MHGGYLLEQASRIIIFGSGRIGCECLRTLRDMSYGADLFVDNDSSKQETRVDDVPVLSPYVLTDCGDDDLIVIAVLHHEDEIRQQLSTLGVLLRCTCITHEELLYEAERWRYYKYAEMLERSAHARPSLGKVQVLYDHQIFAAQTRGGITRYFVQLISGITRQEKFDIDLFQGIHHNESAVFSTSLSLHRMFVEYSTSYIRTSKSDRLNDALFALFTRGIKYDIFHPTYYTLPVSCKYRRLVVTVHDMIQEIYGLDEVVAKQKKRIINEAHGIIAVSENTKKDLMRIYHVDEHKIRVIYEANGLKERPLPERLLQGSYILYVGKRDLYKNAEILVRAFAASKETIHMQLLFFGGGEFTEGEKELFEELDIDHRVLYLTGDDAELATAYRDASVFVYPSKYEGFGLPVLEAMHYGAPVITSDTSSLPEVGGDAALFIDPESVEDMRKALERVLADDTLRKDMIERGYEQEKKFSWERAAQETIKFYEDVLQGG